MESCKLDVPLAEDTCDRGCPLGPGGAQPCPPAQLGGEEQDIPGEPLWGRAPHFPPLIDRGEVKQPEPSQACVPRGELALQIAGSLTASAYYSLLS